MRRGAQSIAATATSEEHSIVAILDVRFRRRRTITWRRSGGLNTKLEPQFQANENLLLPSIVQILEIR